MTKKQLQHITKAKQLLYTQLFPVKILLSRLLWVFKCLLMSYFKSLYCFGAPCKTLPPCKLGLISSLLLNNFTDNILFAGRAIQILWFCINNKLGVKFSSLVCNFNALLLLQQNFVTMLSSPLYYFLNPPTSCQSDPTHQIQYFGTYVNYEDWVKAIGRQHYKLLCQSWQPCLKVSTIQASQKNVAKQTEIIPHQKSVITFHCAVFETVLNQTC